MDKGQFNKGYTNKEFLKQEQYNLKYFNQDSINEDLRYIELLRKRVKKSIRHSPPGHLRCRTKEGKYIQYYYVREDEKEEYPIGRYLRKNELKLAKQVAQKQYGEAVLKYLEDQEKAIRLFEENCRKDSLIDVYEKLAAPRKLLVDPYVLPDDEYIKQWEACFEGESNGIAITNGYLTERGENVRSKSEKIIADKLLYKNIPYIYEAPLNLGVFGTVYPDFTILNLRTRKTYYYEHLGMMDSPEYCQRALEKIEKYEANGMYLFETLLITMECGLKGLNIKQLDSIIERYLL